MKKVIWTVTFLMGIAPQSHALHYFNCSNTDGSAKIVEHEIWGANPVGCYYQGVELKGATVHLQNASKMVVDYQENGPIGALDWEETFTIKAIFSIPDATTGNDSVNESRKVIETHLICREVSTSALDFAGRFSPCEVIYE